MADLQTNFDPGQVPEGSNGLEPVPPGEYIAHIIESDVVPAKTGNGLLLNLTWEIVDGEYQNRKFWQRINYQHTSAQAQMIGQQQLKAICDAVGIAGHISNSEVLHFKPCRVRVAIDAKDPNYAPKNEVKSVKLVQAQPPAAKQAAQPAAQPAANPSTARQTFNGGASSSQRPATPPAGATRPWGNRAAAPSR